MLLPEMLRINSLILHSLDRFHNNRLVLFISHSIPFIRGLEDCNGCPVLAQKIADNRRRKYSHFIGFSLSPLSRNAGNPALISSRILLVNPHIFIDTSVSGSTDTHVSPSSSEYAMPPSLFSILVLSLISTSCFSSFSLQIPLATCPLSVTVFFRRYPTIV